jgi:hypothetical protein
MLGYPPLLGAVFAVSSMAGDLVSSFIKRRTGKPSSSMALGLDQIPESALPIVVCWQLLGLDLMSAGQVLVLFFVAELILSKLLFRLHVRDQPY